jgi:hypothetical protein
LCAMLVCITRIINNYKFKLHVLPLYALLLTAVYYSFLHNATSFLLFFKLNWENKRHKEHVHGIKVRQERVHTIDELVIHTLHYKLYSNMLITLYKLYSIVYNSEHNIYYSIYSSVVDELYTLYTELHTPSV